MTPKHPLLFSLSVNSLWKRAVRWGKCRFCMQLIIGVQDGCDPPHKRCTRRTPAYKHTQTNYAHGAAINSCSENYFWEKIWKTAFLAGDSIDKFSIYQPIHISTEVHFVFTLSLNVHGVHLSRFGSLLDGSNSAAAYWELLSARRHTNIYLHWELRSSELLRSE